MTDSEFIIWCKETRTRFLAEGTIQWQLINKNNKSNIYEAIIDEAIIDKNNATATATAINHIYTVTAKYFIAYHHIIYSHVNFYILAELEKYLKELYKELSTKLTATSNEKSISSIIGNFKQEYKYGTIDTITKKEDEFKKLISSNYFKYILTQLAVQPAALPSVAVPTGTIGTTGTTGGYKEDEYSASDSIFNILMQD